MSPDAAPSEQPAKVAEGTSFLSVRHVACIAIGAVLIILAFRYVPGNGPWVIAWYGLKVGGAWLIAMPLLDFWEERKRRRKRDLQNVGARPLR